MNFEFYDEREKHTKDSRLKIFKSSAPYFRKFLEGKHQGTPNLKFLENQTKIFENQREINKKTPNLKFGTKFNREIIIYEKFLKRK